jgi:hypothetical protein
MASFQLCYNLNKYTSDWDSILGLHPALWAIAVIGPLVRVNICGIVTLYQISQSFCVSAASLHLTGPTTHWFQSYKQTLEFQQWDQFMLVVVSEFEVDTHRTKTMELLNLKQWRLVEDCRMSFEQLVYHIQLYDNSLRITVVGGC